MTFDKLNMMSLSLQSTQALSNMDFRPFGRINELLPLENCCNIIVTYDLSMLNIQ
jgi:hypothetical protein